VKDIFPVQLAAFAIFYMLFKALAVDLGLRGKD